MMMYWYQSRPKHHANNNENANNNESDNNNHNNVQVGSCGKNQVCAQEEEEELMGEEGKTETSNRYYEP